MPSQPTCGPAEWAPIWGAGRWFYMSWNSGFSKGIMVYLPKCNHAFAIIPCNHWPLFFSSGCWAQGFGTIITVTTFCHGFWGCSEGHPSIS